MPNLGQDTYMAKLFPQLRLVKGLEKAAFIPPAFGATMLKRWPRTRAQIRKMVDEELVWAVHAGKFARAHGNTNYKRWFKSNNPYEVAYDLM